MKTYEDDICCLLGLKIEDKNSKYINCVLQSWMASNQINRLVEFRKPIYMENIFIIPIENYSDEFNEMCTS